MNASTELVCIREDERSDDDFFELFSDLDPLDPFVAKKDEIATQLAALASFVNRNRTTLAHELGWKKSRVSNVLSGRNNLTIKTIWEIASHLSYDFDVVFRSYKERRPPQPWQKSRVSMVIRSNISALPVIELQTAGEVAADFFDGKHKSHYFSLKLPTEHERTKTITIDARALSDPNTTSFPSITQLVPVRREVPK